MAYLTEAELRARFDNSEIDELVGQLASADADAKVAAAIADAEAMANSYFSRRYAVPLDASALVKRLVADVARYYLYDDHVPERVEVAYKDRMAFLKDIANGKADLVGAADEVVEASAGSSSGMLVSTPESKLGMERY